MLHVLSSFLSLFYFKAAAEALAAQCFQVSMSLPYFRSRGRHGLGSPGVPGRQECRHHLKTPMSQKFVHSLLGTFMKTFFFFNLIYLWNLKKSSVVHTHRMKLVARGWCIRGKRRDTDEKTQTFSGELNKLL